MNMSGKECTRIDAPGEGAIGYGICTEAELIMITARGYKRLSVAALALVLAGLTGCQTWVGGMTLPSPYYLDHKPQYFRPDPDFPLEKELATQQGYDRLAVGQGAR
jgi:hypothetical protein